MASFKSFPAQNVGTQEVELYSNDSALSAVITSCNVANLQASNLPVTIGLRRGTALSRIVPNRMIPGEENIDVSAGKTVVMAGDKVVAFGNTDDAFDIILSILEGV
jgi:hypothetical protein